MTSTGEAILPIRRDAERANLAEGIYITLQCSIDVLLRIVVTSQILRNESLCTTYLFLGDSRAEVIK